MSSSDLTARARIRDAAITLFAERGIGPATIRDIALKAGVSSGLLRHHFGSKEGLRDACDEFALERMAYLRGTLLSRTAASDAFAGAVNPESMRLQLYLVRSMMDGSPAAELMFHKMVDVGEEWIADQKIETRDPRIYSAALVAMKMGMFVMRDQLGRVLDLDLDRPANHARLLRASMEIFSQPLADSVTADQAYEALDRLITSEES
jgi:TetR/AcrR family transcriptional regulator, regulator of cefoperazone and chloramphenicol sensitivity